jgi:hypothetical protein
VLEIQRCSHCGYCAPSISEGAEEAKAVVETVEYRARPSDPGFPSDANHFRCHALIMTTVGNHTAVGWAAMHAAWICDDPGREEAAKACRREAIASFTLVRDAVRRIMDHAISDMLLI